MKQFLQVFLALCAGQDSHTHRAMCRRLRREGRQGSQSIKPAEGLLSGSRLRATTNKATSLLFSVGKYLEEIT